MNYFCQVVPEILEKLAEKLFWKLRKIDFVAISWNFLLEKVNIAKSCFFLNFKMHISIEPVILEEQQISLGFWYFSSYG